MKSYVSLFLLTISWFITTTSQAQDIRNTADSLFNSKKYKDAIGFYKKLLKNPSEKDYAIGQLGTSYERFAMQLMKNKQFEAAIVYFDQGIKLQKKLSDGKIPNSEFLREKAHNYCNVGLGLLGEKDYQPAGRFLKKSIAICEKNGIPLPDSLIKEKLASCYIELGNIKAAENIIFKLYDIDTLHQIADNYYCDLNELELVTKIYKLLRAKEPSNTEAYDLQIARCYYYTKDYAKAIEWYSKIIYPEDLNQLDSVITLASRKEECIKSEGQRIVDNNPVKELDMLQFAQSMLNGEGKYNEARTFFDNITVVVEDERTTYEYKVIKNTYYVEKLGGYINTSNHEFSPVFSAIDSSLIFVSDRDPKDEKKDKINKEIRKVSDLYKIRLTEDDFGGMLVWSDEYIRETKGENKTNYQDTLISITRKDSLSNDSAFRFIDIERDLQYNEGPLTFFPNDPSHLVFTGNAFDSLKALQNSSQRDKYRFNTLRLFDAKWNEKDSSWSIKPIEFSGKFSGLFNNHKYSMGHPSFNKQGTVMYFSSDVPIPNAQGNSDIYKADWDKATQTWKDPINLGKPINSSGNEVFPFLHTNNVGIESLYFSSNRTGSMGGLDIYKSFKLRGNFSEPINLGDSTNLTYSVNSSRDDFGFILNENETYGFFTSDRDSSLIEDQYQFSDDIYKFKVVRLEVTVCDERTGEPIENGSVLLHSDKGSSFYRNEPFYEAKPTNKNGKTVFLNLKLNEKFKIVGEAEGYLPDSVFTNTIIEEIPKDGVIRAKVCLKARAKAALIVLANIKSEQQVFMVFNSEPYGLAENVAPENLYELFYQNGINYLNDVNPNGSNHFIDFGTAYEIESMEDPQKIEQLKEYLYNKSVDVEKVTIVRNIRYNFAVPDPRFPNRKVFENKLVKPEDELTKIAEIMQKFPDLMLKMSSHTDACPLNNENNRLYDNHALSQRRNQRATSFLVSLDLDTERIKKCAYEYHYPVDLAETYDNCKNDYNRRTEFKLVYKGRDGYVMDCNCHDSMLYYLKSDGTQARSE